MTLHLSDVQDHNVLIAEMRVHLIEESTKITELTALDQHTVVRWVFCIHAVYTHYPRMSRKQTKFMYRNYIHERTAAQQQGNEDSP